MGVKQESEGPDSNNNYKLDSNMKKLVAVVLVLFAALVVLPGGAVATAADAQPSKFEVGLVKTALLVVEQAISAETGKRAEIKYQSLTVDGEKLVIQNLTLTIQFKKPTTLTIRKVTISDLQPRLGQPAALGLSAKLEDVSGQLDPTTNIKAGLVQCRDLMVGLDQETVSVGYLKALDVAAEASDMGTFRLAFLEVTGFSYNQQEEVRLTAGSLKELAFSEGRPGQGAGGASLTVSSADIKGLFLSERQEKITLAECRVVGVQGGEDNELFKLGTLDVRRLDFDANDHVRIKYLKAADVSYYEGGPKGPQQGGELLSFTLASVNLAKLSDPSTYSIGKFEVRDLGIMTGGRELLRLARVATTSTNDGKTMRGLFVIDALKLNAASLPNEAAEFIKQLGHDALVFNLRAEADIYHATQVLDLKVFKVWSDQLGTLSYSVKMGGFKVDPNNPMLSTMRMQQTATIISGKASYQDVALVPAIIAMGAKDAKQSPAQFTEMLIAQVRAEAGGQHSPAFKAAAEEVIKFLRSPGEIHVNIKPAKPVKIGALEGMNEDQAIAALNVTFTTKPRPGYKPSTTVPPAKPRATPPPKDGPAAGPKK